MVTGDHPITAHSIAKSLGIITFKTSFELSQINDLESEAKAIIV